MIKNNTELADYALMRAWIKMRNRDTDHAVTFHFSTPHNADE